MGKAIQLGTLGRYGHIQRTQLLLGDHPQSEGLGLQFIGHFVAESFARIIVRMIRRANAEVGPAAIAIAIIVGLLYIYLGGALHWGYGPASPTRIEQVSK